MFMLIFQDAFNLKPIIGGFAGSCIVYGIKRGLFSNEAGVGSGAIAAATVDNDDARGQGMIQMLGIYFTTLINVCQGKVQFILPNLQISPPQKQEARQPSAKAAHRARLR